MKVLVVDDDRSVRESLGKVLRESGYEVVLAADGAEALRRFDPEQTDMLLLDLGLPMKSGWDTFERITRENPVLPIIVITGQSKQYNVAVAAGVGAFMEKPVDVPQLLQTMRELLAEPKEERLHRLCGHSRDVRHVPPGSASFLKQLRQGHDAPIRHQRQPVDGST